MRAYLGVKLVQALAMTLAEATNQHGVRVSSSSQSTDESLGYLVVYDTGYKSWSPQDVFDDAYRPVDALPFSLAIEALKQGLKVAREGWNGKNMWIALGSGFAKLEADKFWNPHSKSHAEKLGGTASVEPYIIFKNAQDNIQMGWQPSQADVLADDWFILED